jgi:hypothetical protein
MKAILRGLNPTNNSAKLINTQTISTIKDLKNLIKSTTNTFKRTKFYLVSQGKRLSNNARISQNLPEYQIRICLLGGKGGFGSLLKRQPAVKKRTNNFDACRDLSGRRLRHVNQEKMLIEFQKKKEEEERFIKEYEQGDADIKEKLNAVKREEADKLNYKFFMENELVTQTISKSIRFLLKKRRNNNGDHQKEEKKSNDYNNIELPGNNIELPLKKGKKAKKSEKVKKEKKVEEEFDIEKEIFAIDY